MAMSGDVAYALSKKYVKDTLEGAGALKGEDGVDGKSAYQIAVSNGYDGTEVEWLESLNGTDGKDGESYDDTEIKNAIAGKLDINGNGSCLTYDYITQELEPINTGGMENYYGRVITPATLGINTGKLYGLKEYDGKIYAFGHNYFGYTENIENEPFTTLIDSSVQIQYGTGMFCDFIQNNMGIYILTDGNCLYMYEEGSPTVNLWSTDHQIDEFITTRCGVYGLSRTNKCIFSFDGTGNFHFVYEFPDTIYQAAYDSEGSILVATASDLVYFNPFENVWNSWGEQFGSLAFDGMDTIVAITCADDVFIALTRNGQICENRFDYRSRSFKHIYWGECVTSVITALPNYPNYCLMNGNDCALYITDSRVWYSDLLDSSSFGDSVGVLANNISYGYEYKRLYSNGTFYFPYNDTVVGIDLKKETKPVVADLQALTKENNRLKKIIEELEERISFLE